MTTATVEGIAAKRSVGFNADTMLGLLLVLPILVTMAALVFYPMGRTVWDSLHRVNPMQAGTPFVGLENYTRMLSDGQLGTTWTNTLIYVVLAVVAETVFGVLAAALINQVKQEKVKAIFGSEVFPSPVLAQIGKETGVTYVDVLRDDDLLGKPGDDQHSWLGLMRFDFQTMVDALGGDSTALKDFPVKDVAPDKAEYPQ